MNRPLFFYNIKIDYVKFPVLCAKMSGEVYCLSNPSMPGLLKFGRTEETSAIRARSLYTTGVPEPFIVEQFAKVDDSKLIETTIHKVLAPFRTNTSREFFRINIDDALEKINEELPDLVWEDGSDCEDVPKSKRWDRFVEKYNRIRSDANTFQTFMIQNKWFPNSNDFEAEIHNESDYRVMVDQPLHAVKDGINARPDVVGSNFSKLQIDDKSIRNDLKKVESFLTYMRKRFEANPNKDAPCMCRLCMSDRKQYIL